MTTTTRGCPATQFLTEAVRERALNTGAAKEVDVRLTYDPPWSPDMMST
jgi:metal-sulfur cluster biosynthetic enzyme